MADGDGLLSLPLTGGGRKRAGYGDIARHFGLMGWTAYGGPAAHIGFFSKVFVDKLAWFPPSVFMELLALCQCMPGPTSTQMSFALGVTQRGVRGGLLSGALFQFPGALVMSLIGLGTAQFLTHPSAPVQGAIAGLAAAGIALIASAAKDLMAKACAARLLGTICALSALASYYRTTAWLFPVLLLGGGAVTVASTWRAAPPSSQQPAVGGDGDEAEHGHIEEYGLRKRWGAALIVAWLAVLLAAGAGVHATPYEAAPPLHWFELFYRTGSLIFGGGQVVLPYLYSAMVQPDGPPYNAHAALALADCGLGLNATDALLLSDSHSYAAAAPCLHDASSSAVLLLGNGTAPPHTGGGWISASDFNLGLAAAQAMPGPLFNFAAYLGAVVARGAGYPAALGIALCWLGLFGPGVLLIFGVLPFWGRFRRWRLYRHALPGLNAAATGLIVSAVITLVFHITAASPFPRASVCIGIAAYAAVDAVKAPAPLAIALGGALGYAAQLLALE